MEIRILEENQSILTPLLSACPGFLACCLAPSSPHHLITLPPFPACHLPPPDILSANGRHCSPRTPITSCQLYLKGAVKILVLTPCRLFYLTVLTHQKQAAQRQRGHFFCPLGVIRVREAQGRCSLQKFFFFAGL